MARDPVRGRSSYDPTAPEANGLAPRQYRLWKSALRPTHALHTSQTDRERAEKRLMRRLVVKLYLRRMYRCFAVRAVLSVLLGCSLPALSLGLSVSLPVSATAEHTHTGR